MSRLRFDKEKIRLEQLAGEVHAAVDMASMRDWKQRMHEALMNALSTARREGLELRPADAKIAAIVRHRAANHPQQCAIISLAEIELQDQP
jgi:uncharacterized protein with beta-barrel porin domain